MTLSAFGARFETDIAIQGTQLGVLVDSMGRSRFAIELARILHQNFAADHVHMVKIGRYERDLIQSASYDGSDKATRLTKSFFDRKLNRFERPLITDSHLSAPDLDVQGDHTQAFPSPEFRSFGREMGIGARFLIRRTEPNGAIAVAALWSIDHGDVSHLYPQIRAAAAILAPVVGKHMTICDDRLHIREKLSSVLHIQDQLRDVLGEARRREAQVGARIIAGQSAIEISGALEISKETVITHRKKLYDHLQIDSARDLLLWYLAHHSYGLQ